MIQEEKNHEMLKFYGKDTEKTEPAEIYSYDRSSKIVIAGKNGDRTMIQPSG